MKRREKRQERREKIKRAEGKSAGAGGVCYSTSPPSGNLVDGLPLVCHTKTVAKRGRLGARTQVHLTMKIMFLNINAS